MVNSLLLLTLIPPRCGHRNGKKLKVEKNLVMTFQDELAVLEIQNVLPKEDSGKYSCTATNKVGKATHSANITVGADIV